MKTIKLTNGNFTLVDDNNFDYLNQWKWGVDKSTGYVRRVKYLKDGKNKQVTIYMHRLIAQTPKGFITDHWDLNKLNNQKNNLRICIQSDNCKNQSLHKNNTSGYKGVSWNKLKNKWHVGIWLKRINIHIGYFKNKKEAAKAYDLASIKYHGEFGRRNFENSCF
jgi:hypothetical protein